MTRHKRTLKELLDSHHVLARGVTGVEIDHDPEGCPTCAAIELELRDETPKDAE